MICDLLGVEAALRCRLLNGQGQEGDGAGAGLKGANDLSVPQLCIAGSLPSAKAKTSFVQVSGS